MITKEDEATVGNIKRFIEAKTTTSGTTVDWEKVAWCEILDKLVDNLKKAPESYRECSKEDLQQSYFTAECSECGWWGSSALLEGGAAIGDTGDHTDCFCPVCGNLEIDEKIN